MAEKPEGRWAYIAGIAVLVVLVVGALIWRGSSSGGREAVDGAATADGGDAASEASPAGDGGAGVEVDGSSTVGAAVTAEAGPAAPPEDPDECRAYCRRLEERGELGAGMNAASCAERLCGEGPSGASLAPADEVPVPTVSEPAVPELPSDCEAQCRALGARGELREGMTVAQCVEALCADDEDDE